MSKQQIVVSDLAKDDAVFVLDTGLDTLWSGNWIRQHAKDFRQWR